jgi:hypothetical protein
MGSSTGWVKDYKKRLKIPKGGNQNPYIEEKQTTQCQKEKVQKDKQRSTKHAHKTKDRVTRTPLKTGGELRCFGRVSISCSTGGIRRVNLVTHPVIGHEWGKDLEVFTISGTYPLSFVALVCSAALKNKSNDWLAWHYDNVIEWSNISTHGLLFSEEALSQLY